MLVVPIDMEVMVTDAAEEVPKFAALAMLVRTLAKRLTMKGALLISAAVSGTVGVGKRGNVRVPGMGIVAGRGEDEGEGTVATTTAWGVSAFVRESVLSYPSEVYRPVLAMF